jgi:hypothetical protein
VTLALIEWKLLITLFSVILFPHPPPSVHCKFQRKDRLLHPKESNLIHHVAMWNCLKFLHSSVLTFGIPIMAPAHLLMCVVAQSSIGRNGRLPSYVWCLSTTCEINKYFQNVEDRLNRGLEWRSSCRLHC